MQNVIEDTQKRIASNGGKLPIVDLGVLAIEHGLSFRFLTEMLEDSHVIPCGTYELISRDLSDTEIMKAAEQKMHPTLGVSAASDSESKPAPKRVI